MDAVSSPANTRFAVATHVLTYLGAIRAAGPERAVGSDELAGSVRVSPVHVRRVLGPLRRAGLVASRPGPGGGWLLGADPADIPLVDVFDALRDDERLIARHDPSPDCPIGRLVQDRLDDLDTELLARVRERLGLQTVADLLGGADQSRSSATSVPMVSVSDTGLASSPTR